MISKKIILTGSFGVGKTSLFNQFLYQRFSEKYLTTIGVKVDRKVVNIDGTELSLLIWDIAGEVNQDKVPVSYFLGASGIIYVCDLTRHQTYMNMERDLNYLKGLLPNGIVKIAGNKKDLLTEDEIEDVLQEIPIRPDILTSAKTGDKVEDMFQLLGKELLK